MSAILDRKTQRRAAGSDSGLFLDQAWAFQTHIFRTQPAAELERLRATLAEYDPHDHVTSFANPGPEYGPLMAKFLVYLFLAAIPAAGAALLFLPVFSC